MAGESPAAFKTSSSSNLIDTSSLQTPLHKPTLASAPSSASTFWPPGTVEVLRSQSLMEKPGGGHNEIVPDSQPEVELTLLVGRSPSLHENSLVKDSLQDPSHVLTPQVVAYQHEDEDDLYSLSPEIAARLAQQASQKSSQARAAQLSAPHPRNEPVTPMPPKVTSEIGAVTSDEALKSTSSMQRLREMRANRGNAPAQISEPQRHNIEGQTGTRDLARQNLLPLPAKRTLSTFKPNLLVPQIPPRLTATEKNTETPAAPMRHSNLFSDATAAPTNPVFATHKKPGSLQKIKKLAQSASNSDSARLPEPADALPASPWEVEVSPEGLKKSSNNIPKRKRGRPRKSDPTPSKVQPAPTKVRTSTGTRSMKAAVDSEDDDNDVDYVNLSAKPPATAARPTRASRNNGPLLELPPTRSKGPQKQASRRSKGGPEATEDHQGQDNVQDLVGRAEDISEHIPVDKRVHQRNENHETLDEFVDAVTNDPDDNHVESEIAVAKQRTESFKPNHELNQANESESDLQGQSGTRHEDQREQVTHTKDGDRAEGSIRPQNGQRQTTMRTWGQTEVDTSVKDQVLGSKPIKPKRSGTQDAPIDVMSDPPSTDDDEKQDNLDQCEKRYQDRNLDLPKLEASQHAPFVPSSPPAAPKVDGKHFTDDSLRIAERASRINKPHVIHFSDKGPKNQGTLSGKNTAHVRNHDQSFDTNGLDPRSACEKQRRPETSAEEAMQEILGRSAKRPKIAIDDTTWIDNDAYTDQIASPTHAVHAAKAAPTACMAPPPKPMAGSASVKPQIPKNTSLPSRQQPLSTSKLLPLAPMLTTVNRTLDSTTFGYPRVKTVFEQSKHVEDQEQESKKLFKRTNFASPILAASLVTKPVPPSTLAESGTSIHQSGLGKSMLGSSVKNTQRQRDEDAFVVAAQTEAQRAKATTVASPALVKTSTKRQSDIDYAALSKRPKVVVGEDAQWEASRTFIRDAAPPRKLSQHTITDDGSPVRQEQEESYSQQQLDLEQASDDEIEAVRERGRYFNSTLSEHVMTQTDAPARDETGTGVVEALELVLPKEALKSPVKHQSSIAEEESQAISHAGFDHENDERIVSQHNPLSDPAMNPFVIMADERKKKDAVQLEFRAQQSEDSFLGRLRLGIRQAIDEQYEEETGDDKSLDCEQDEDDPDKTLVEAEPGHEDERTDEDDKSSQSSSSDTRSTKVRFEDEFTQRIRTLQPHQRSFHDGMFRVVHELVSHLIDAETAVKDVVHDYRSDCAMLLEQMEESQRKKVEDYIQRAMTTKGELAQGFKAIVKRVERDMVEVAASRVESEKFMGHGAGNALTKLDNLLQRFAGES